MSKEKGFEDKKLALLRMMQIFEKYSDFDHPLKQQDIVDHLYSDYGIILERKAVGRNISLLNQALEHDRKPVIVCERGRGAYLESREFTDAELRLLIDSVLSSRHITAEYSKEIIEKLCGLSNRHFRSNMGHVFFVNDWSKTENKEVFYNIEIIGDAIEKGNQIVFKYKLYGADRLPHTRLRNRVSPYQLILHNQRYYLVAYDESEKKIEHYRLDRIYEINIARNRATPLRSLEGYQNGIDYRRFSSMPYMYADNPVETVFLSDYGFVDTVVDSFGLDVKIEDDFKLGMLRVTVNVSPSAMEYWAMQYVNYVEVLSPLPLREKIRNNITAARLKYGAE